MGRFLRFLKEVLNKKTRTRNLISISHSSTYDELPKNIDKELFSLFAELNREQGWTLAYFCECVVCSLFVLTKL